MTVVIVCPKVADIKILLLFCIPTLTTTFPPLTITFPPTVTVEPGAVVVTEGGLIARFWYSEIEMPIAT